MQLGIELAASWMQVLTCHEIANEIDNSLDFLTTTARNVPERHRSLRAVFERSWEYLAADEQACLSKLSIFRGGFSVGAAQFITGASLTLLLALSN
jgi:predicted ATPase